MKKIARRVQQMKRSIFDADRVVVYHGDCLNVMASMPETSVDTIVTDPPYGLEFMGKEWDKLGAYQGPWQDNEKPFPAARNNRVRFGKSAASMQSWHEAWTRAALRVAKPGAHLVAFGGTRTFHRLACAIEDAGWEMRDCLMWVYGSGFPKSLDVSKAIDKAKGAKRAKKPGGKGPAYQRRIGNTRPWMSDPDHEIDGDEPATPEAARWRGWGTGLKPSWEPIILARKPLDGTVAECVLRHGTGALNVDGCRIGTEQRTTKGMSTKKPTCAGTFRDDSWKPKDIKTTQTGRWPPNAVFQHDARCVRVGTEPGRGYKINRFKDGAKPFGGGAGHEYESESVPGGEREVYACVPGCPVRMLDGQNGNRPGMPYTTKRRGISPKGYGIGVAPDPASEEAPGGFGGSGGASRFFYCPKANTSERVLGCPPGYENRHPTVKPLDLCRWLCRLTKTPDSGVVLDPFSGSGSIAVAALLEGCRAIAIELEEESANATVARVQATLKYGNELQNLKRYKLKSRKKMKRRQ